LRAKLRLSFNYGNQPLLVTQFELKFKETNMTLPVELILRSTTTGRIKKTLHKTGQQVQAEADTLYELRLDGKRIPEGSKLTRRGSKLKFTFPDGNTFEISDWNTASGSKIIDLQGATGFDEVGKTFVEMQQLEGGEFQIRSDSGQILAPLGTPESSNNSALASGLGLLALGGGGGGGGGSASVALPGNSTAKLANASASVADGSLTNSKRPTLTGKSIPGDKISISLSTGEVLTTTASPDGTWSVTPSTPLPDGEHQITVTATSKSGVVGAPTTVVITVDTTAPSAPTVQSLTQPNNGFIDESDAKAGIQVQVNIAGTGAKLGDLLTLQWGGQQVLHRVSANEADLATITLSIPAETILAQGNGTVTVTAALTDLAGNLGVSSNSQTTLVALASPTHAPKLLAASDSGLDATDLITNDQRPRLGIDEVPDGYSPVLLIDGKIVASRIASVAGGATLQPETALPDGNHAITIAYLDAQGVQSPASAALNVVIDTLAPISVPAQALLDVTSDTGASSSDQFTDEATPIFSVGRFASGESPLLYVDGVMVSSFYDPITGFLSPINALMPGAHEIATSILDLAGNEGPLSAAQIVTIVEPPLAPLDAPIIVASSDSGFNSSDGITDATTPEFYIAPAPAGLTPTLYVDGHNIASSYDAIRGALQPLDPLSEGTHTFNYRLMDAYGITGAASPNLSVTIDLTPPPAPTLSATLATSSDTGISNSDAVTSINNPGIIIPELRPGETATLYVDGIATSATWDGSTHTFTPSYPWSVGTHQIRYTITDEAGNESAQSTALSVQILSTPDTPGASLDLPATADQGISNSDNLTNDASPSIEIPAPPIGLTPTLYIDGVASTASFDTTSHRFTLTSLIPEGIHSLTYTLTNVAGVESAQSSALVLNIDTIAPNSPAQSPELLTSHDLGFSNNDNLTGLNTPAFVVASPLSNETVRLYVDGVAVQATYDSVANTITPTFALTDGVHSVTTSLIDAAGNESAQSSAMVIQIDTAAPDTPSSAPDLISTSDSGAASTDNVTKIAAPSFLIPTMAPGESASLYIDGISFPSFFNPVSNTLTTGSAMSEGIHAVTMTITDAAGNASTQSLAMSITIDTTAPTLSSTTPNDNAVGMSSTADLVLNFNESVTLGSGHQTLTLYDFATGIAVETFDATTGIGSNGGTLTASGSAITVNPGNSLTPGRHYNVQTQEGAITDLAGNAEAALTSNTAFDFTTSAAAIVSVENLASTTYSKYLHSINPNLANSNTLMYTPGGNTFGTIVPGFSGVDDTSAYASITPAFSGGLNWFGTIYNEVGLGTNGYMTFGHLQDSYVPSGIPGYTTGGMIAVQFDDFWSQHAPTAQSPGGNSLGTNNIYFSAYQNAGYGVLALTYDDVGPYANYNPSVTDGLTTNDYSVGNAEQIRLVSTGNGDIVIQLVYENVSWIDVWGKPTAGWTKGDGETFGTVDGTIAGASSSGISGTANFLDVELASNVGIHGVFEWVIGQDGRVGSGTVPMIDTHATSAAQMCAQLIASGGTVTYSQDLVQWDSRFTLVDNKIQANAGVTFAPGEANIDLIVQVHDIGTGITTPTHVSVQLFDQIGGADSDQIGLRDSSGISNLTSAIASQVVMNGGAGIDSLVMTGTALNLDLTLVQDSALINVEHIDLGSGNSLKLALSDVLSLSSANVFNSDTGWSGLPSVVSLEQLVIDGNASDTLTVANSGAFANQWNTTSIGTVSHGGHSYAIYHSNANTAELLVDQSVQLIFG
jgi:Bacterial Ig-like domain